MQKLRICTVVFLGKLISFFIQLFGLGAGATWPGEIVLRLSPNILSSLFKSIDKGVIIVAGTNGKTTTSLMITNILASQGNVVIHNASGANLDNGIVSAFVQQASWAGHVRANYAVFEVDENTVPHIAEQLKVKSEKLKVIVVLLNLFRDQLDRYGEVDVIARRWNQAFSHLEKNVQFVVNSDDPQIAYLGTQRKNVTFFGVTDKKHYLKKADHATDSTFCLSCGHELEYSGIYFSHIGIWNCPHCSAKRPEPTVFQYTSVLPGLYNTYNANAAAAACLQLGIPKARIEDQLAQFTPAFGRQESFKVAGKTVKILLSKNPAGFTVSLRAVSDMYKTGDSVLLVLNDRIPDGRDVSWIWDVDFDTFCENASVIVSGDRTYDLALRIKYANQDQRSKIKDKSYFVEPKLQKAIKKGIATVKKDGTLYILSTYSAMLEARKILTGRKIL